MERVCHGDVVVARLERRGADLFVGFSIRHRQRSEIAGRLVQFALDARGARVKQCRVSRTAGALRIPNAPDTVFFDGADRDGSLAMYLAGNRAETLRELRHLLLKRDADASRVKLDDVIGHSTVTYHSAGAPL